MTATASLFFDDALIGTEEAPQRVLEAERFASTYHAVLKKRLGHITTEDFLRYARRFTVLCNEIYQGSMLELRRDKSVPLGFAVFAASQGVYEGNPGETIDIGQLTANSFREMFEHSSSMVLDIRPRVSREDIRSSFAQIKWTRGRPRTIFFYAQQGGRYDLEGSQRPLENLLLRKLFHVSGVAPSINFAVKLGVGASLDEAEGKPF
ncbi:MAG: hypothetical protein HYW77_00915 [Parcubacteria group bacterium]|nr:hypothetical protein [Parcubacteria group bacterium]